MTNDKKVTIQSRVARNKFSWGLGVRAVRAGSIGRDVPRLEENTASPKWGAGGLGPRPSPPRSQRLMIPSGPAGPPGRGTSWPLRRSSIHSDWPPVTEGVHKNRTPTPHRRRDSMPAETRSRKASGIGLTRLV